VSGRLGWAVTGAGHLVEEIYAFVSTLEDVDLFQSRAAEEVMKMYRVDFSGFRGKKYLDASASSPVCGRFAVGRYRGLIVAPASSNSVAKFVAGIGDTLITNIFAMAGKSGVPIVVFPTDVAECMETTTPGGVKVMVHPRKVDLDNTEKLAAFEGVTVVRSLDELKRAVRGRFF